MTWIEIVSLVILILITTGLLSLIGWQLFRRYVFHKKFTKKDERNIVIAFLCFGTMLLGVFWGAFLSSRSERLQNDRVHTTVQTQHPELEVIDFRLDDRWINYYQADLACTGTLIEDRGIYYILRPDCTPRK